MRPARTEHSVAGLPAGANRLWPVQFSAAAKPCLFVLSVVTLLATGCGAFGQTAGDEAVLRSEALAFDAGTVPDDRADAANQSDAADRPDPVRERSDPAGTGPVT